MESMRVRDVEDEELGLGLDGDLIPRRSKLEIHNHNHHNNFSEEEAFTGGGAAAGLDFTDTEIEYNYVKEDGEARLGEFEIEQPRIEAGNNKMGEVVNSDEEDDSREIGGREEEGSFDFDRNYVMNGIFDEQIRVSGSIKHTTTNGQSEHDEHQITSYSSQETTISDCISEEPDIITKSTPIPNSDEQQPPITIPETEILKSPSVTTVIVHEREEDVKDEYEVDKVLEKQEAYDLFCPNCQSCITKRVVLKRRKRKAEEISVSTSGGGGVDPESESEPIPISTPAPPQHQPDQLGEREVEGRQEPILYRCLSCFSIFIPSGWLRRREDTTVVIQREQPPTDVPPSVSSSVDASQVFPPSQTPTTAAPSSVNQPIKPASGAVPEVNFPAPAVSVVNFPAIVVPAPNISSGNNKGNETSIANEAISKPQPDLVETMALPTVNNKPITSGIVEGGGEKVKAPAAAFGEIGGSTGNEIETEDDKKKGAISNIQSEGPALPSSAPPKLVPIVVDTGGETDIGTHVAIPIPDESSHPSSSASITQQHPDPSSSLTTPLLQPTAPPDSTAVAIAGPSVAAAATTTTGRISGPGIIKSMVYGGLLETIASLSVVSSAAGAETATLNILALGIANLFGGIFALGHNLRVLKHETDTAKYEEALGEPGHFRLHATVAVLSYFIFGAIPPVVYAFAFRESDLRDYKMAAVAVAALVAVVLLSVGKAYVRRGDGEKGYLKTVSYYVGMAVLASGVAFVVGDFLDWVLGKLGWFSESSSGSVGMALASSY